MREYAEKFDGWCPERLELSREEMEEIAKDCDPAFLTSLKKAAENIRAFHQRQKQQSRIDPPGKRHYHRPAGAGGCTGPGCTSPGGTAGYPSSVLMNVIPAQVAEVGGDRDDHPPPGRAGRPDPNIIAAALVAGVDRVFLMGGAQAVAALAYGTQSVPKVDKIVGPGEHFRGHGEEAAVRRGGHRHDRRAQRDF